VDFYGNTYIRPVGDEWGNMKVGESVALVRKLNLPRHHLWRYELYAVKLQPYSKDYPNLPRTWFGNNRFIVVHDPYLRLPLELRYVESTPTTESP
jgi:hypothetical protein